MSQFIGEGSINGLRSASSYLIHWVIKFEDTMQQIIEEDQSNYFCYFLSVFAKLESVLSLSEDQEGGTCILKYNMNITSNNLNNTRGIMEQMEKYYAKQDRWDRPQIQVKCRISLSSLSSQCPTQQNQPPEPPEPIAINNKITHFQIFVLSLRKLRAEIWYQKMYASLIIIFSISMFLSDPEPQTELAILCSKVALFINCIFILTTILRLLSFEPIHPGWCSLEFCAFSSGVAIIFVQNQIALRILKAITCLRVMIIVRNTSLLIPFQNLILAMKNVNKIILPSLVLVYLYSVVALYSFSNFEYNRCRMPEQKFKTTNWTFESSVQYLCGNRQCPVINGTQLECLNPLHYGVQPNPEELNVQWLGCGLLTFQDIFHSFFNIYKLIFLTGWSRSVVLMKQSVNQIIVFIFYISFIYMVSYVYMNILYGMMMVNESENNNPNKIFIASIEDDEEIEAPLKFNKIPQEIELDEEVRKNALIAIKKIKKDDENECFFPQNKENEDDVEIVILEKGFYLPKNERIRKIVISLGLIYQYFNNFMIVSCILYRFVLDSFSTTQRTIEILDIIFTLQFTIHIFGYTLFELIKRQKIKVWCQDNKADPPNGYDKFPNLLKLEIGIYLLCTTGILYEIIFLESINNFLSPTRGPSHIFRSFKYIRILALIIQQDYIMQWKIILKSTIKIIRDTRPFIIFYFILVITLALFIFYLLPQHHETLKQDLSFHDIFSSFIIVILTFYNQEWDIILFNTFQGHGNFIIFFQILCVTIGVVFVSKYLTAFLVNQLIRDLEKEELKENNLKIKNEFQKDQENEENQEKEDNKVSQSTNPNFLQIIPYENVLDDIQTIYLGKENPKQEKNVQIQFQSRDEFSNNMKQCESNTDKQENSDNIYYQTNIQNEMIQPSRILLIEYSLKKFFASFWYEIIYSLLVFIHVIEMTNRVPTTDRSTKQFKMWEDIDNACTTLFFVDCILKIIVFGFKNSDLSFLNREKTNVISFIILPFGILMFIPNLANIEVIYKLSKLKILRVLVIVDFLANRNKRLKLTLIGYTKLVPKVIKFLILICIIYGFFAVILSSLYADKFWHCVNYSNQVKIDNKWQCLQWGGDWIQEPINTNTSINSLMYVMLISSTEGWMYLMSFMSSIKGIDLQPEPNTNNFVKLFFIAFFFFGNMIVLNLFIGVSIHTMNKITRKEKGAEELKKPEEELLMIKQKIHSLKLYPKIYFRPNSIRYYCEIMTEHRVYKIIKILLIFLFFICLSINHSNISKSYSDYVILGQFIFALISFCSYIVESLARKKRSSVWVLAFHIIFYLYALVFCTYYFSQPNTRNYLQSSTVRFWGMALLVFQVSKYWHYLYEWNFVKKTLKFMQLILPSILHNLIPIVTILILYTFLGTELFPYLRPNTELNEFDQNYRTFFNGLFSLLKFSTWESPIDHLSNAAQQLTPNFICFSIQSYSEFQQHGYFGCGSKVKSYLFFFSFHVIYSMILLSSLTANIFNSFCEVKKQEQISVDQFQLAKAKKQWLNFDEQATGFIAYHNFWRYISKIHFLYGLSGDPRASIQDKSLFLAQLDLPIYNENGVLCFEFFETLEGIILLMLRKKYKQNIEKSKVDHIFKKVNDTDQRICMKSSFTSKHVFTIILLRKGLRIWKKKIKQTFIPNIFSTFICKTSLKEKMEKFSNCNMSASEHKKYKGDTGNLSNSRAKKFRIQNNRKAFR